MATPVHYRDAVFAYVETAKSPQAIVSACVFAASDRPTDELAAWLAERASKLALARRKMVRPLGDIGLPVWADDPNFDADRHIHVHEADDWEALCALLPAIHAAPFDWSRPLWERHLIRGVRGIGGRDEPCDVVVGKIHHAVVDGKGGAELIRTLFSAEPLPDYVPEKSTTRTAVTTRAVAAFPVTCGRLIGDLVRYRRAKKQVRAEADQWAKPVAQWPRTAINRELGPGRVVDATFFNVAELSAAAAKIGDVTVNDVVLAVIGGALADYLGEVDGSLAATVPISTRDLVDVETHNRFTTATVNLHTEIADPVMRVRAVHDEVRAEWARKLSPAHVRADAAAPRLPGFVIRAAVRVFGALPKKSPTMPFANFLATSVPMGPAEGWELAGSPILAHFGMTTLVEPGGVGYLITTIGDRLAVSVTADPRQVPDLADHIAQIRRGYERLMERTAEESVPVADEGRRLGA
ncbi:MAG: DUF1298 domain-containing protein [Rhodococcus sp.]|nr:DUF1298 domain-containing protein [Rhodococcus sp. (in: high G+C Gram-positive bacteria)]